MWTSRIVWFCVGRSKSELIGFWQFLMIAARRGAMKSGKQKIESGSPRSNWIWRSLDLSRLKTACWVGWHGTGTSRKISLEKEETCRNTGCLELGSKLPKKEVRMSKGERRLSGCSLMLRITYQEQKPTTSRVTQRMIPGVSGRLTVND